MYWPQNTEETQIKRKESRACIFILRVQSVFHPWLLKTFRTKQKF